MKQAIMERSFIYNELPHLCVVIPMYNAQDHIEQVITTLPQFIQTIVIVDDCSQDDSYQYVKRITDSRLHLVRHHVNQGVGGAMLAGYRKSLALEAEIIIKMDADVQMDPAYLLPLITPILLGEADYTKGNRFLHTRQLTSMPLLRRVGNLGLSFLTKLASGYWNIFDPTNGYTAIHALLLSMLDESTIDRRYFFESSMLLELGLLRAVVSDVYVPARYGDEITSLSELEALLTFPPRLFKSFVQRIWTQYFLRDFGIFTIFLISGTILLLFGLSFGIYNWIHFVQMGIGAPTGTIMLAVLPIILGIQFLLQAVILDIQNVPTRPLQRGARSNIAFYEAISHYSSAENSETRQFKQEI
jgi:glycosyltransferase involved in cell wall biosynthesis